MSNTSISTYREVIHNALQYQQGTLSIVDTTRLVNNYGISWKEGFRENERLSENSTRNLLNWERTYGHVLHEESIYGYE
jgi:hypothetical protein